MSCSQKQLEANRRNALKSTGPVTQRGKERSRMNAVKHGLTADVVPVGEETQEQLDIERQAWLDDMNPRGHIATKLLERAFRAFIRVNRCDKAEDAGAAKRVIEAEEKFDLALKTRLQTAIANLETTPIAAIAELESFPDGCDWLTNEWGELVKQLKNELASPSTIQAMRKLSGGDLGVDGEWSKWESELKCYHSDLTYCKVLGVNWGNAEASREKLGAQRYKQVMDAAQRETEIKQKIIVFCLTRMTKLLAQGKSLEARYAELRSLSKHEALIDDSPEAARRNRYASEASRELTRQLAASIAASKHSEAENQRIPLGEVPTPPQAEAAPAAHRNEAISEAETTAAEPFDFDSEEPEQPVESVTFASEHQSPPEPRLLSA